MTLERKRQRSIYTSPRVLRKNLTCFNEHIVTSTTSKPEDQESKPEVLQREEHNTRQENRSFKDIAMSWLPTDFHTLLYGVLTSTCAIYAVHTANSTMLVTLWTATAGVIGVDTTKSLIQKFKESSSKKTRTQRPPKAE